MSAVNYWWSKKCADLEGKRECSRKSAVLETKNFTWKIKKEK